MREKAVQRLQTYLVVIPDFVFVCLKNTPVLDTHPRQTDRSKLTSACVRITLYFFVGERVVAPMDLVAALSARGYPSEVVRIGTGLENMERRDASSEEPRCGLGGSIVVRSCSVVLNGFCVFFRGDI